MWLFVEDRCHPGRLLSRILCHKLHETLSFSQYGMRNLPRVCLRENGEKNVNFGKSHSSIRNRLIRRSRQVQSSSHRAFNASNVVSGRNSGLSLLHVATCVPCSLTRRGGICRSLFFDRSQLLSFTCCFKPLATCHSRTS